MQGIPRKVIDIIKNETDLTNEMSGIDAVSIRERLGISSEKVKDTVDLLKAQYLIDSRRNDENKVVYYALPRAMKGKKDRSKMLLEKNLYSKPKFVWAIVKAYVRDNNPTLRELEKAFPDDLHPVYGVFKELAEALEEQGNTKRFYTRDDQVIQLKDGKFIAVCSDWGTNNMVRFMSHLRNNKNFGYKFQRITDRDRIEKMQENRRRVKARLRARRIREEQKVSA